MNYMNVLDENLNTHVKLNSVHTLNLERQLTASAIALIANGRLLKLNKKHSEQTFIYFSASEITGTYVPTVNCIAAKTEKIVKASDDVKLFPANLRENVTIDKRNSKISLKYVLACMFCLRKSQKYCN